MMHFSLVDHFGSGCNIKHDGYMHVEYQQKIPVQILYCFSNRPAIDFWMRFGARSTIVTQIVCVIETSVFEYILCIYKLFPGHCVYSLLEPGRNRFVYMILLGN